MDRSQPGTTTRRRTAIAGLGAVAVLVTALLATPHSAAAGVVQPVGNDSPDNGTPLVAPGALASHPDPSTLIREATPESAVARSDVAVARFEVPGLDEYYDDGRPRDELGVDDLSLTVAHVGPNQSGAPAWRTSAANVSVVPAPDDGTLYALWRVPHDADAGDYEVTLTERGDSPSENRSVRVRFTVVGRDVTLAVGETAIFQPATTVVVGDATVAPGTYLTLQARSPGEPGFPVNATVVVRADRTFTARMDFGETTNGTAFTLAALGYPDSARPGRIVGPAPVTPTTTPTESTSTTTTATPATTTETDGTATTKASDGPTRTGGQSGFGLAAAMLAVVVALLIASRTRIG